MNNYYHFKHWACSLPCDERKARAWAREYVEKNERSVLAARKANLKYPDDPQRKRARDGMRKLRERRREGE